MSNLTPEQALERAQQAAEAARQAAQAAAVAAKEAEAASTFAQNYVTQIAQSVGADVTGLVSTAAAQMGISPFVFLFSVFVLAIFVGYYVVWSVTPALHTPLMSVTNAISSVIVVGALLAVAVPPLTDDAGPLWARIFGFLALVMASVNIFGGFLVTQRMLGMYKKKTK